jgi:hypothetical protein
LTNAQGPGSARLLPAGSALLAVAAVVAGVWANQLSYAVVIERARSCNGMIHVPDSAFFVAWLSVALAVVAVIVAIISCALASPTLRSFVLAGGSAVLALSLLVVVMTRAWIVAIVSVLAVAVVGVCAPRARQATRSERGTSGGWTSSALIGSLVAVLVTVLLCHLVYGDAVVKARICKG